MDTARNITQVLDALLEGYDKRLRPGFGGDAIVVKAALNIRSMGPVCVHVLHTPDDAVLTGQGHREEVKGCRGFQTDIG